MSPQPGSRFMSSPGQADGNCPPYTTRIASPQE
jgi:hypothetical protein